MPVGQREKKAPCAGEGPLVDLAPEDMEGCDLGPAEELALATKEGQEDGGSFPLYPPHPPAPDSSHSLCHQWREACHWAARRAWERFPSSWGSGQGSA